MTDLKNRLRGLYPIGPHLPNGLPEFGWRQFEAPPIQFEAATRIEQLEDTIRQLCEWKDAIELCAPELGGFVSAVYRAKEVLGEANETQI